MSDLIFHIDVNSAYLSWSSVEKLKKGSLVDLRTVPSIIGGDRKSRHGVVLAKSIPAKKFGIQTGEPVAAALRKCPTLIIEPPDHNMYRTYSKRLTEYLYSITPDIEQVSIDECYLNFAPISHNYPSFQIAAEKIRKEIRTQMGFTVNIGISSKKVLAKMASDFEKPDKTHTLFPDEIKTKMWPLPVEHLFMVGRTSALKLHTMGIHTIGSLAAADPELLTSVFKSHGRLIWEYANGIDNSFVDPETHQAKGIGNSTTLSEDARTMEEIETVLGRLSEKVSLRLRKAGQLAGTLTVEIKYHTFQSASRQMQLLTPSNSSQDIYRTARQLAGQLWNGSPVRLLGIRSSKLTDASQPLQMSIFDLNLSGSQTSSAVSGKDTAGKFQKLDAALDQIRQKYGPDSVKRASSIKKNLP